MSNEKRPAPDGAPAPSPTSPLPDESEPDFFSQDEHDGWGPIEKRRPSEPSAPPVSE